MTTPDDVARAACDLTEVLARTEPVRCTSEADGGQSCIHREGVRPLTAPEEARGWARRPFDFYDPDRLCLACQAYWHASQTASALNRYLALAARLAATRESHHG